ncbi:DUF6893 family small protein [Saccharopolyspora cebuensis]
MRKFGVVVLVVAAAGAAVLLKKELPAMRRYLRIERM